MIFCGRYAYDGISPFTRTC